MNTGEIIADLRLENRKSLIQSKLYELSRKPKMHGLMQGFIRLASDMEFIKAQHDVVLNELDGETVAATGEFIQLMARPKPTSINKNRLPSYFSPYPPLLDAFLHSFKILECFYGLMQPEQWRSLICRPQIESTRPSKRKRVLDPLNSEALQLKQMEVTFDLGSIVSAAGTCIKAGGFVIKSRHPTYSVSMPADVVRDTLASFEILGPLPSGKDKKESQATQETNNEYRNTVELPLSFALLHVFKVLYRLKLNEAKKRRTGKSDIVFPNQSEIKSELDGLVKKANFRILVVVGESMDKKDVGIDDITYSSWNGEFSKAGLKGLAGAKPHARKVSG